MRVIQPLLILIACLSAQFITAPSAYPQSYVREETLEAVPPGMKLITFHHVRYLVPKGTKFRKRAGVITFEGPGEYTARTLSEFEDRIRENEKHIRRLKNVLRDLESKSGPPIR